MNACERALSHAKKLHIEECEIISVQKKILTIRITDSEIAEIKQNYDNNLGVRVINQKKISSASTSNLDNLEKMIEIALSTSAIQKPKEFWRGLPSEFKTTTQIKKLYDKKLVDISDSKAADIAITMINAASHAKVDSITGSLNIVSENVEISNTNGLNCVDDATFISGTINTDSKVGNSPVSGIGQASCRTLDSFSANSIGADSAEMCVNSINPHKPESGEYSIIFDPYSVGELLSFVFASNFSLKTYCDKKSCFSDKIGSKIAVDEFNLIDDAHFPDGIGSKIFDDEGITTKPKPFIENGVFQGLYSDLFNAYKEGKESSGNATRIGSPMGRSADPIPTPTPHNMRIIGGKMNRDEIIKETKKGLLVGRLWYTYAVNPTRGDFSCTARSGIQIIENGEIKYPGASFRIVHNLPLMLQNISAIGNDSKNVLQWASLPSITPTIKAERIKIIPI
ncbi:MAG TPA: TldD/PmbA family protein [Nitrosopumilaceae archaeon]|nr:TldD/PmbA family protein [Nitrosopumilaceae archaeon]